MNNGFPVRLCVFKIPLLIIDSTYFFFMFLFSTEDFCSEKLKFMNKFEYFCVWGLDLLTYPSSAPPQEAY